MMDPMQMANQFATFDIQPFQLRYEAQAKKYQDQLNALGKVESALRDFRSEIDKLNTSTNGVIKNTATVAQDGYFSASADATAQLGNYQIFVEQVAVAQQVQVNLPTDISPETAVPSTGTMEFTVNGESMSIDLAKLASDNGGTATIADLTSAINNDTNNSGVNATLVRANGKTHFMLSSTETGVANEVQVAVTGTNDAAFEAAFSASNMKEIAAAKDAVIWLGAKDSGLQLTSSSNTFSDVIQGVDITVSKAHEAGNAPTSVAIGADLEGSIEQVDAFIGAYNKLIDAMDEHTSIGGNGESRGALASDPTIRAIESQLSTLLRGQFGGERLIEAGISIDRDGKLSLDKEQFEQAQKTNSAGLESLFNGKGNLLDSLDTAMEPYLKFAGGTFNSRKEALQGNIDRIDDKQAGLERKFDIVYKRYLTEFTQMNQIMTQMQQTSGLFG